MKDLMKKLFAPVLAPFESGESGYAYRPSHRKILVAIGALFILLSSGALAATVYTSEWGGIIPVIVFMLAGIVCEVVALLGSDQAVARIWKSK